MVNRAVGMTQHYGQFWDFNTADSFPLPVYV